MSRRRFKAYRQGRLDGLCGVYALISALRLLCPKLDEDAYSLPAGGRLSPNGPPFSMPDCGSHLRPVLIEPGHRFWPVHGAHKRREAEVFERLRPKPVGGVITCSTILAWRHARCWPAGSS